MKLVDEHKKRDRLIDGILKVERVMEDGTLVPHHEEEFNLVVSEASYILRDLMFGDNERIDKIHFGDMNLIVGNDLKNVKSPSLSNTKLDNKLYQKIVTREKTIYGGHPSIQYVCTLERNEFNGDGEQLITEFALATSNQRIFTRKTRAGIYKDNETSFRFTWVLVFNAG